MTASTPTTVSPSRVRMARNTPWADGRCGPLVQILVDPEVHGLVELAGLGLPVAHVARVLLAARQHALGETQPLAEPADLRAVPAQLVDVAAVRRRLERGHRREDLVLLREQQRTDLRHGASRPLPVLGELTAQPPPGVQVGVDPEVDVLVQRPELRRPAALELPV